MVVDVALVFDLADRRPKRPSSTPCTRSHNSTEISGSCRP
jgi:hypothetical protein